MHKQTDSPLITIIAQNSFQNIYKMIHGSIQVQVSGQLESSQVFYTDDKTSKH